MAILPHLTPLAPPVCKKSLVRFYFMHVRAVDSTIVLVALGSLASAQSNKGTQQATAQAATHLLNYCATHPDAIVACLP
jgi:hypothetical protein